MILLASTAAYSFAQDDSGTPEADAVVSPEQEAFFENEVRPILIEHCSACHGDKKQESELRVDSRSSLLRGGASGEPAIVPGDVEQGTLLPAVRGTGDYEMPPEESLSEEQIEVLEAWVSNGAPWPKRFLVKGAVTASERVPQHQSEHWAFQPIQRRATQTVSGESSARVPLDAFIQSTLTERGLEPSPEADRRTLFRRLKLDLLGVPPTYEEMVSFLEDSRPDAYERWVDRWLASPAYGERWGRHWLDVARYADTRGYAFNRDRRYPYAYTYRDYVIQSFNDDLPYDRFVVEQLAADQLDLGGDRWRLAGLGFLTVGRKFNNIHEDMDDKIDVVTRGLLGLTVACARCHDHKYDAIPTEDYYSLYGVFISTTEPDELPLIASQEAIERNQGWFDELENLRKVIEDYTDEKKAEAEQHARERVYDYLVSAIYNLPEDAKKEHPEIELEMIQIKSQLRDRWKRIIKANETSKSAVSKVWNQLVEITDDDFEKIAQENRAALVEDEEIKSSPLLHQALVNLQPQSRSDVLRMFADLIESSIPIAESSSTAGDSADSETGASGEAQTITIDGKEFTPEEVKEAKGWAAIVIGPQGVGVFDRSKTGNFFGRSERDHVAKLTSKITAHQANAPAELGRAMVVQDRPKPVKPFVFQRGNPARRGKNVDRQFVAVLSGDDRAPFPNGSGRLDLAKAIVDPQNPLTARVLVNRVWMHHFRDPLVKTPSDFGIRSERSDQGDALDYLAGKLIDDGWSVKELHRDILLSRTFRQSSHQRDDGVKLDPENRLLWRQNRQRLSFEATRDSLLFVSQQLAPMRGGKSVDIFSQVDSPRRTIYATIDRQDLPNLLRTFDFASPDQHAPVRPRTVVPQQALFLMNSEFIQQRSRELVKRLQLNETTDTSEGISRLYHQVLARDPVAEEVEILQKFLDSQEQRDWHPVALVLLETNELVYVD